MIEYAWFVQENFLYTGISHRYEFTNNRSGPITWTFGNHLPFLLFQFET